jgi:hypothetical protein
MDAVTGMNAMALLLGVAIGLVAGYLLFPAIREAKVLREQLDRTLREHEDYKASVGTHFRKTADLVGQMTRSYAAVYDHLATGARTFGGGESAGPEVPFDPLPGALASPVIEAKAEPVAPVVEAAPVAEEATVESEPAADAGAAAAATDAPATDAKTGEESATAAGDQPSAPTDRKDNQPA